MRQSLAIDGGPTLCPVPMSSCSPNIQDYAYSLHPYEQPAPCHVSHLYLYLAFTRNVLHPTLNL